MIDTSGYQAAIDRCKNSDGIFDREMFLKMSDRSKFASLVGAGCTIVGKLLSPSDTPKCLVYENSFLDCVSDMGLTDKEKDG